MAGRDGVGEDRPEVERDPAVVAGPGAHDDVPVHQFVPLALLLGHRFEIGQGGVAGWFVDGCHKAQPYVVAQGAGPEALTTGSPSSAPVRMISAQTTLPPSGRASTPQATHKALTSSSPRPCSARSSAARGSGMPGP